MHGKRDWLSNIFLGLLTCQSGWSWSLVHRFAPFLNTCISVNVMNLCAVIFLMYIGMACGSYSTEVVGADIPLSIPSEGEGLESPRGELITTRIATPPEDPIMDMLSKFFEKMETAYSIILLWHIFLVYQVFKFLRPFLDHSDVK